MADQLTEVQIAKFKAVFQFFDQNGDGSITTKKLGDVLRLLGENPSEAELQDISINFEGGTIDFPEFLSLMANRVNETCDDAIEEIIVEWKALDKAGTGFITAIELRKILSNLKDKPCDEEIDEIMGEVNIDGDGRVNYEEFIRKMMTK
mmetsp:Transcript_70238/g.81883  ORF Transcript_70238/g.81883 Transcript_70238/m.81883 type:complete len:149 (+) Transcript_70238:19-465(+)